MSTALDILIRAKDEASRAIHHVGTEIRETSGHANTGAREMNRFSETGRKGAEKLTGALKGLAAGAGFVAVDEMAAKSLEAFDQLEVGEKRLGFGLKAIGENKDQLEGLVDWSKDFSKHTGILEADVVGMQSKLVAMGGNFLRALGPKADGTIKKLTAGMVNLGSVTGKSASLLLRSLGPAIMNSPKTAISQLQKYGVLTDRQIAKVTKLTKAGKNHAASMLEINALYKKFNGAAAAAETPMDKLKNGINQLELNIGSLINKGLAWLINVGWPAMQQAFDALVQKARPFLNILGRAAQGVLPSLRNAWNEILPPVKKFLKAIEPIAKVLAVIIGLVVLGLLKALPILITILAKVISSYIRLETLLINVVVGAIKLVIGAFQGIIDVGKRVVGWVSSGFDRMVSFLTGLPGRIRRATSGMWDGIKDAFRGAINWIIRGWNGLQFTLPKVHIPHIGTFGGETFGTPDIPYLAHGGIATRATLAVVGEAGPEAIVPLSRASSFGFGTGADDMRALYEVLRGIRQELVRLRGDVKGDGDRVATALNTTARVAAHRRGGR